MPSSPATSPERGAFQPRTFPPPPPIDGVSVVGEFTISTSSFALEQALSTVPEMTVEGERLVSHSPEEAFPFLWATDGDFERFEEALRADETVTDVDVAQETESEVLYRMEWTDSYCDLVHEMVDHHAAILEATAKADHWNLRLRFAQEEMVSSFQEHFREQGYLFEVNQLYHPTEPRQRAFGLTADQHQALVTAVEEGYFDVPRRASTEDVAEALGISANAVSERIRRGCDSLVRSGLRIPDDV